MGIPQPRWLRAFALSAATTLIAATLPALLLAEPAAADTSPTPNTVPTTVSTDPLPTTQINGVAWSQIVVGNTVYVGGDFSQAQPAGAAAGVNTVARTDILAYDLSSGVLVNSFAPTLNGQVRGLAASPDGSRIYAVGTFTTANGAGHQRIVALDAHTGAVISSFKASANAQVSSVAATATTVYFGGMLTSADGVARTRAAAVSATDGSLLPWAPAIPDDQVRAILVSPDGSKVALGGGFDGLNGDTTRRGSGMVDATTGTTNLPWAVGDRVYDSDGNAAIFSLSSDGTNIYGTGFVFGSLADGNLEGTFNASWNGGTINWIEDCHGDSYSAAALNDVVYVASHEHTCQTVGAFPQTNPDWTFQRGTAFTKATTGVLGHNIESGPYYDWGGTPAPTQLDWYPDLTAGTYTGQTQAAWNVATSGNYVLYGGEFPSVNGVRQQGLVRFAMPSIAPNKDGPRVSNGQLTPNVVSNTTGTATLSWRADYDRDNSNLTYSIYRNGNTTTPVHTMTAASRIWFDRPSLQWTDTGLQPGSKVSYRIQATDPFGNSAFGYWTSVTVTGTTTPISAYDSAVVKDGASNYWRLSDASGSATAFDSAGPDTMINNPGVTFGAPGPIAASGATAATFSGDSTGFSAPVVIQRAPQTFSVEAWFKTTTTTGGKILGFGNNKGTAKSATSTSYDRHLYMNGSGVVSFGVYPGSSQVISSAAGFNDGQWHYVVGTLGANGMQMYLDGKRIGSKSNVTSAQDYYGYWRIGGDSAWDGDNWFDGSIADVAVYPTALAATAVKQHWQASGNAAAVLPAPADAYGAAVYADGPDSYWRLGEASGTTAADASGNGVAGIYSGGVTQGTSGAIAGTTDTAVTLDGASGQVVSSTAQTDPEVYSLELWFKTATTQGGRLIGFGDQQSGLSGNYDRHVWMLNNGQLEFGTWTGQTNTITSPSSYNDNVWHHVVATQGPSGLQLFVDGVSVGTNPQTQAQGYTGYWRVGGDNAWGGNSSAYFAGAVDEVAIYSSVLTSQQIANHYALGKGATNQPPVASFTAKASGLKVDFDGTASSDSDGTIASYAWDFGDGSTGTGATPSHTYATGGNYTVTLTVTDNGGASSSPASQPVAVTAPNVPPTAAFTATPNALAVGFDASASSDSDGTIASYAWDFGDSSTGTGKTPSHTYAAAGSYSVTLTVTDNQGATATVTHAVQVSAANVPPTAAFTATPNALAVGFDASASSDSDGTIASYAWDFGDSSTGTGKTPSHTYAAAGSYSVTLTVTDNQGATATVTHAVQVSAANVPPTAAFTATPNALAVGFDASASSDSDGTIASYAWDFGDSSTGTGKTPSHTYAAAGSYSVTLTVTDNQGATATVTHAVQVSAANVPPTAAFTATPNALAVGFDASASSDSDGTIASYAWDFGDSSTGTGKTPSHTYAAAGSYSVTLTVTDNQGGTGSVTHQVTVTAPATNQLASDGFTRTVASGLGKADLGGSWTTNSPTSFSVDGSKALVVTAAGKTLNASLSSVSSTGTDLTETFGISALPVGSSAYMWASGRTVGSNAYVARAVVNPAGAVSFQVLANQTVIKTVNVAGLTVSPTQRIKIRFQVIGTSPTTLNAKVWAVGSTEPSTWQISTTDSTSALQTAGGLGFGTYLNPLATNGPVTIQMDDLVAVKP